jgi:ligand-binding sensor domain-containing protein
VTAWAGLLAALGPGRDDWPVTPLQAQEPPGVWTTYTSGNVVTEAAVDERTGELWAATKGGVVRWRPRAGTYVKYTVADGLADNTVYAVAIDPAGGDRWFGTGGGVSRLTATGKWLTYTTSDGLSHNVVFDIAIERTSGDLWFATYNGVSRRSAAGIWSRVDIGPRLGSVTELLVQAVVPDERTGDTWFALGEAQGARRRAADGSLTIYTSADGLPSDTVNAVALGEELGEAWFGTNAGLARLRPGATRAARVAGVPLTTVNRVVSDPTDQAIWFTNLQAVGGRYLGRIGRWAAGDGLTWFDVELTEATWLDSIANAVTPDPATGSIWVSTWGGLGQLASDRSWRAFRTGDGLTIGGVFAIGFDRLRDIVWLGSEAGLNQWRADGSLREVRINDLPYGNVIYDIEFDAPRNDMWFGTIGDGAFRLSGDDRWTNYAFIDPVPSDPQAQMHYNTASDIAIEGGAGAVWFGTLTGVRRLASDGTWTLYDTTDGLAENTVEAMDIHPATGDKWFGHSAGGVSWLSADGTWRVLTTLEGLASNNVRAVAVDRASGDVWFGTGAAGVSRRSPSGRWRTFTTRDGLAHDRVVAIAIDVGRGETWFGTNGGGVSRLSADGRWSSYDPADGLASKAVTTIAVDEAAGDVWFGMTGGLGRYRRLEPGKGCAQALPAELGSQLTDQLTGSADADVYAFGVPESFTRVNLVVPDPDDALFLEVYRACDPDETRQSDHRIWAGTSRHVAGEQRLTFDVTTRTGTYYLRVSAKPAARSFPLVYRLQLGASQAHRLGIRTLALTDEAQVKALFGLAEGDAELVAWRSHLDDLVASPAVDGLLVGDLTRETDEAVEAAIGAWRDAPRDVARANAVALALRDWIGQARRFLPRLQHVVLAGDDRVIPHLRLAIRGEPGDPSWKTEDAYAATGGVAITSTIGSALALDFTLSDDVYAAVTPTAWGAGQSVYIPELAVGRLVERPRDMTAVIQAFLARGGTLPLHRSVVAGYDFMADAPAAVDAALAAAGLGPSQRLRLVGERWTVAELRAALFGPRPDLAFLAVHASHYAHAAPAGDLLAAREVAAASNDVTGTLVFALACHGALNVPGEGHAEPLDFPQAWQSRGAMLVGTTGWAYGLERVLAYEEVLMTDLVAALVAEPGQSVGGALTAAKRAYSLDHRLRPMHAKTLAGTVLFGLPMARVEVDGGAMTPSGAGSGSTVPAAAGHPVEADELAQVGSDVWVKQGSRFEFPAVDLEHRVEPEGSYYTFSGQRPLAESGEPIQPQFRFTLSTVTREGQQLTPRGVVLTGGRYRELTGFSPLITWAGVFGRPAQRAGPAQAGSFTRPGWYPPVPIEVRRLEGGSTPPGVAPPGSQARVLFTIGQYHSQAATERLFEEMTVDEYYSQAADTTPPQVEAVWRRPLGPAVELNVRVADASGIARVAVAYTRGQEPWRLGELAPRGDVWTARFVPLESVLVQAVDAAGNVTAVYSGEGGPNDPRRCGGAPGCAHLPALRRSE